MSMLLQIVSLILMAITFIPWLVFKKIKNYHNHFFFYVLSFTSVLAVVNLLFTLCANNIIVLSINIINWIARFNLIFILVALFVIAMLVLSKVYDEKAHKQVVFPLAAFVLFEAFIILVAGVSIEEGSSIISGNSIIITYVFGVINILAIIAILILNFKKVNKWFAYVSLISVLVIVCGFVVHIYTKMNGVIEASIVIATVIFYYASENPINKIDTEYYCFKSNYITQCLDRFYNNDLPGFALFIGMRNELLNEESENELVTLRKNIIKELSSVPEVDVFLSNERDIFAVCDDVSLFDDFVKDVNDVIEDEKKKLVNEQNVKIAVVFANDIHITKDSDALYKHLTVEKAYALSGYKAVNERFLNDSIIDTNDNEEMIKELIGNALNKDLVEVYYQPVYSSKEKKFLNAEALMRIRNEDGSIVMPGKFIGVAERTGLINLLGERVLEKVCQLLVNPEIINLELDGVDINLSLTQCENLSLADNMIEIAKKYNIDPKRINFEITESNFEGVHDNLMANIRKMKEFGFSLSLDDFGTGKTDIYYLIDTPISKVHIDRHVVWNYFESAKTKTTVKQLIKLCHELNIDVVATGIEKISQLDEMALQNVDYIQGYYFFKPMSTEEFIKFLKPAAFEVDKAKSNIIRSTGV